MSDYNELVKDFGVTLNWTVINATTANVTFKKIDGKVLPENIASMLDQEMQALHEQYNLMINKYKALCDESGHKPTWL